jgi:hypothetical protein
MNRKLRHTSLALSATATAFLLVLLAASPAGRETSPTTAANGLMVAAADATEAAGALDPVQDRASHRRHLRHSRAVLALPYFSFAQGLRRIRS